MLFTVDGQLNLQMKSIDCYGSVTGGYFFVNLKQSYINAANEGVAAFRFKLPEKAFISKLEIATPEKKISTQYINTADAEALRESLRGGSPVTLDENGIFTAVIGIIKPQQPIDISFTYIQEVSPFSSVKLTLPIRTTERLAQDFTMSAKIIWCTAKGNITISGTHNAEVCDNSITLKDGYLPDKDITLELRAEEVSQCAIYKGTNHTLLDTRLCFEPIRRQHSREYLFIVDTSKAIKEQWDNIKNALLASISALNENEAFNIVAFGLSPRLLSIGSLKATDSSKNSAKIWLDDIKPAGSADISEALNFTYDLCTRKTEIFLITNSQFINASKILTEANREYASLNVISGNRDYSKVAIQLAQTGRGIAEDIRDIRDIADGLCRAVSRNILTGAENTTLKTDKNSVWHMENTGKLYPWDKIQLCKDSSSISPEYTEISAHTIEQINTKHIIDIYTKAADLLCDIHSGEKTGSKDIPADNTTLCMLVASGDKTLTFPISGAEGGGTDKPSTPRKNSLALLAMQTSNGSIGSPSETAGRIWEVMTSHPTPSIFMYQIKKAVEFLLEFVHLGEYDLMPDRIIDVFELWLEMFPSDTIFTKKMEALVYMNRK